MSIRGGKYKHFRDYLLASLTVGGCRIAVVTVPIPVPIRWLRQWPDAHLLLSIAAIFPVVCAGRGGAVAVLE